MATNRDYYDVLGIDKGSSGAEIKAAYRKQALQWHPDRNKSSEAEAKFKEINESYEVLSNADKRAAYDQFGHQAFSQGGPAGGGYGGSEGFGGQQGPFSYTYTYGGQGGESPFGGDFEGFSDPFQIFEQFFGASYGGMRGGTHQRRKHYSLEVSLKEAVNGCEKTVNLNGQQRTIKIPAGVDTGSRIRFSDFDLSIEVKADKNFRREGDDIFGDLPLSFSQAVLGTVAEVETLQGKVKLRIQPGTQPETLIRLRGQGVPHLHGRGSGDHYTRVKINVPTSLTKKQKESLEELNI